MPWERPRGRTRKGGNGLVQLDIETRQIDTNGISMRVAVAGDGPLVILVHGFPELWYSWRHQIPALAAAGYRVAAPDVRGYGGSDKPPEVDAYRMRTLSGDIVELIDALGGQSAVLIGHDWGAPICWNTAMLHPGRVRAVAGLSVPFFPRGSVPPLQMYRVLYAGRFFYQLYFQEEGVAETELEADVRTTLRKVYYGASGDNEGPPLESGDLNRGLLDGRIDPDRFPAWMTDEDLDYFVAAFEAGGFRGPLNRYRCMDADWAELTELSGAKIFQPSFFMAGSRDLVRHLVPGYDLYVDPGAHCADFRGQVIVDGKGHWIQQEAAEEVTEALLRFLSGV